MNTQFSLIKTRSCCIAGYLAAGFLCLAGFSVMAQTVISGGTRMTISPGTMVHSTDHFGLQNNASVNNKGTLILKKNLVNHNSSANPLGSGHVVFSGITSQFLGGENIIQGLTLDNAAGLSFLGNTRVNGMLTLTSGRVTLGFFNLLLGASAFMSDDIMCPGPTCPCPGPWCSYVIATGSGQFRKVFQSSGSFTFPVGDAMETTGYSPVKLSFASGTFGTENYVGVNLVNAKYPDTEISGSYLNRYWKLSSNNISAFSCSAVFQYNPEDVVGNEDEIWSFRVEPAPWVTYNAADTLLHQLSAKGLSAFGTFTGNRGVGAPLPPAIRSLQDITAGTGQTSCYDAVQSIIVAGNGTSFLVQNGSNVHFVAGQKISLLPGTKVEMGGMLHGYIATDGQYCNSVKSDFLSSNVREPGVPAVVGSTGSKIKVYPNPTPGNFTLETDGSFSIPGTAMEIYGSRGDRILTASLDGERKHEFSLSGAPSGLYFIRVIAGPNAETTKIIKQ